MNRRIGWSACFAVLASACGGTQSASEQPEAQPVAVASVGAPSEEPDGEEHDARVAASAGVLGRLADAGAFGPDESLGPGDAGGALSAMWGDSIGDSFGAGGLGLSGIGRDASGTSEGAAGLGSIGTMGRGGGTGSGYGSGHGRFGRGRTTTPARVRPGASNVTGALAKEVIRRVIRRHLNQLRYCYERRLLADPNLEGKVVTRFTIGPNGNVVAARDAGSTMPDDEVKACVNRVFRRMRFPKPKGGGVVVVTYPLVFVANGSRSADAGAPEAGSSDAASGASTD